MTQLTQQSGQQQTEAEQRRQRRSESLFTRITGFGLIRPSTHMQEEEPQETQLPDEALSSQQHLSIDPSDRPALSSAPEDLLEIPAFLRRQNNH